MKSLKFVLLAGLIIITVLVAGCAQIATLPIETSTQVQVINTATPTVSIVTSPNLTHTPLPTGTPTPVPTLPVEQANTKFLELLSDNGGCRLPCLWGITLGKSTYQEAQAILYPLSGISGLLAGFLPEGGAIFPNYAEENLKLSANVGFNVKNLTGNQMVSRINFEARGMQTDGLLVYDSVLFTEWLRAYTLPTVLSEQGIPAAVMVSTDSGIGRGKHVPGFYVVLLYPDQGILVIYTTSRQLVDGNVRGCLASAHVQMYLSPAGQPDAFTEMLAQTHQWGFLWPDPKDGLWWKSLETATGMTLQEFYDEFHQPKDKCLETPLNLWPTPDN